MEEIRVWGTVCLTDDFRNSVFLPHPPPSISGWLWRVIFALMKASSAVTGQAIRPSRASRPTIQAVCSSHRPPGNQSCFPAALPIRNPLSGPYAQLSACRAATLPFRFMSHGNTDFEPAVFPSSSGIFSFLFACVDSFPLLYPFRTIIENMVFNTDSPEGFLAVASIYLMLYFASSPSLHLLTPQTPSCQLLRHH